MWALNFWFPLPRVSWAALCSQHRCASSEHLQTRELTPGSVSSGFSGAPPRRHDWLSIQLISGSNHSRGAADTAWPKPPSWITLLRWPKLFTLNQIVCIRIRLSQDPQKTKPLFSVPIFDTFHHTLSEKTTLGFWEELPGSNCRVQTSLWMRLSPSLHSWVADFAWGGSPVVNSH